MKKLLLMVLPMLVFCSIYAVLLVRADDVSLTSECVSGLSAIYTEGNDGYGTLAVSAEIKDVSADEYIVFNVYTKVNDISDPTNGKTNSPLTTRIMQVGNMNSDGRINYSINYYSRKLIRKCVVSVQVANRGEVNDWVSAYITAPLRLQPNGGTLPNGSRAYLPIGFGIAEWLKHNQDTLPSAVRDGFNLSGWAYTASGGEIPPELTMTTKGDSVYAVWVQDCEEHSWSPWKITVYPDMINPGMRERKCSICFKRETEELPVLDRLFGDLTGDGLITVEDALAAMRLAGGVDEYVGTQRVAGDIDGDGAVTVHDALCILRYSIGLTDSL